MWHECLLYANCKATIDSKQCQDEWQGNVANIIAPKDCDDGGFFMEVADNF
jgi:hypothetical protein